MTRILSLIDKDCLYQDATIDACLKEKYPSKQLIISTTSIPTLSLGSTDLKAPNIESAIRQAKAQGYTVYKRIMGGRLIVYDTGILSVSIVEGYTKSIEEHSKSFMAILNGAFSYYGIQLTSGLVEGAYCPGDFDLAYNGKKVVGIGYRIANNKICLGCYISIKEVQQQRTQCVQDFYTISEDTLKIDLASMTSLEAIVKSPVNIDFFSSLIIKAFEASNGPSHALDVNTLEHLDTSYQRILKNKY